MRAIVRLLLAGGLALSTAVLAAEQQVTVQMMEQNQSGQSGAAMLTARDGQTHVELHLDNAPAGVDQPAHIHKGSCDQLDPAPAFPLASARDGHSETTVPVSLESLQQGGYAVNVHRSGQDIKTYVSCGNIE